MNRHVWRLSIATEKRFNELMSRLADVSEDSDEHYALCDEIRSLPGFPHHASEFDYIDREITTVS